MNRINKMNNELSGKNSKNVNKEVGDVKVKVLKLDNDDIERAFFVWRSSALGRKWGSLE